jgi:hypothetical protein
LRSLRSGQRFRVKRFAVPLALIMVATLPADALADIRFRGQSGQDRRVTLRTDDAGTLVRFGISWRAPCRTPGYRYRNWTKMIPPYDSVTRDRFVDAGRYRERLSGGVRAILYSRGAGNRVSGSRWRGIFRMRVRVFRGSRQIDRCYMRTRWRVRRLTG